MFLVNGLTSLIWGSSNNSQGISNGPQLNSQGTKSHGPFDQRTYEELRNEMQKDLLSAPQSGEQTFKFLSLKLQQLAKENHDFSDLRPDLVKLSNRLKENLKKVSPDKTATNVLDETIAEVFQDRYSKAPLNTRRVMGSLLNLPEIMNLRPVAKITQNAGKVTDVKPVDSLVFDAELKRLMELKLVNEKELQGMTAEQAVKYIKSKAVLGPDKYRALGYNWEVPPPYPKNMSEILDSPCPIWKGQLVRQTSKFVFWPGGTLREFVERVQASNVNPIKFRYFNLDILKEYGDVPIAAHWVLVTTKPHPDSGGKSYEDQLKLVEELNQKAGTNFEIASMAQTLALICMEYISSGEAQTRLFSDVLIRCKETLYMKYQTCVGGFVADGLDVYIGYYDVDNVRVALVRKF